jgi:hypothetical protein
MEITEAAKEINKLDRINREKLDEFLAELNYSTSDYIYRRLWANHVKEDFISRIKDNFAYLKYSDKDIEECAKRYAFEGDYDCNWTYWDNIDAVIYDRFEDQIALKRKTGGK